MSPSPDFSRRGAYFYVLRDSDQENMKEGAFYLFRYLPVKDTGKTDSRGKPIFIRTAIPIEPMCIAPRLSDFWDKILNPEDDAEVFAMQNSKSYKTAVHSKEAHLSSDAYLEDVSGVLTKFAEDLDKIRARTTTAISHLAESVGAEE